MDKHRVVIMGRELDAYKARGYAVCAEHPLVILGDASWTLIPESERGGLVTVEIDVAKHQRLNQGERAFILWGSYDSYEIAEVQVQEKDLEEATVARTDRDTMPWVVSTSDLYKSRRECAAGNAQYLRDRVKAFRDAASKVEEFIKRIECPPV